MVPKRSDTRSHGKGSTFPRNPTDVLLFRSSRYDMGLYSTTYYKIISTPRKWVHNSVCYSWKYRRCLARQAATTVWKTSRGDLRNRQAKKCLYPWQLSTTTNTPIVFQVMASFQRLYRSLALSRHFRQFPVASRGSSNFKQESRLEKTLFKPSYTLIAEADTGAIAHFWTKKDSLARQTSYKLAVETSHNQALVPAKKRNVLVLEAPRSDGNGEARNAKILVCLEVPHNTTKNYSGGSN